MIDRRTEEQTFRIIDQLCFFKKLCSCIYLTFSRAQLLPPSPPHSSPLAPVRDKIGGYFKGKSFGLIKGKWGRAHLPFHTLPQPSPQPY